MNIIPAIDLLNGKCVRLKQGDFKNLTEYSADPMQCIRDFEAAGAKAIHIVDLNGAKGGYPEQLDRVCRITNATSLTVQMGGGFRNVDMIKKALASGIDRVIIGSLSVKNPELMQSLIIEHGVDRFVLAFDVAIENTPLVVIKGWVAKTKISLWDMLNEYYRFSGLRILCTDTGRDGMLNGPNINLYRTCVENYSNFHFQASGGVAQLEDLFSLKKLGVSSVIIGKALYENRFNLSQAIHAIKSC